MEKLVIVAISIIELPTSRAMLAPARPSCFLDRRQCLTKV